MTNRPGIFLDRDGVINRAVIRDGRPFPPASPEDLEILPGVPESIAALVDAGYVVVVVTNQPDVGTGVQRQDVVDLIHEKVRRLVPVHEIRACYHTDRDGCGCRKPLPGMLLSAAAAWSIDLGRSYMVGDRWRDIGAGRAAGCRTILVGSGYGETMPDRPDLVVDSLSQATEFILNSRV
jgi:D-glycero-D-manno-heptose 1,7-bisphosphate phosphatase